MVIFLFLPFPAKRNALYARNPDTTSSTKTRTYVNTASALFLLISFPVLYQIDYVH